jgi:hypothetical protein
MGKKKPIPMPGFNEAVATLGDWASKVSPVEVRPAHDKAAGYCLKAYNEGNDCVGILRWNRSNRWHVCVGLGSWSVTPTNVWTPEEMNRDTETAIRCRSVFTGFQSNIPAAKPNPNQITLALEPSA